jgi:adenylate kinase
MKVVVLLGAPGSGKGTVAVRLAERLPVDHVSSGDLLRAAVKQADTPAALAAAEAMRKGELVADEVVGALVIDRLKRCAPEEVILLDGYPRNEKQAAALDVEVERAGTKVAAAVWLEVPEEILMRRLAGRRICGTCAAGYHVENMKPKADGICDVCGSALIRREDDSPDRIANRLQVYRQQTAALIGWYESRGLLVRIDGSDDADAVTARVAHTVMA